MNRKKNPFVHADDGPSMTDFILTPHSTFPLRTKTSFSKPEKRLILSSCDPVPIFTVKYKMPIVDHVQMQIEQKAKFRNEKERNFLKMSHDYEKKLITVTETTANMKRYIEHSADDPAPHIKGIVDWNFNRGSLQVLERNDKKFLVNVNDQNSIKLHQLQLKMPLNCDKSIRTADRFVNELMVSENFIGFRNKNLIKVANLSKIDHFEDEDVIKTCDTYDHQEADEIITSSFYNDQLIVMDSNDSIIKYDMNRKMANFRYKFPSIASNTRCRMPFSVHAAKNSVKSMKITYTNAQEFGFIDCRSSVLNKITSFPFESHLAMNCEKIFNHRHSQIDENLTYIVSSHMLYCIDIRQSKEPLVQWPHQIANQPMMITTTSYADQEIVCVSSNTPGDLKLFNFNGNSCSYLPFKPLGIKNCFNRFREDGLFLLSDCIKERVNLSITGIALEADIGRLRARLYTQNAAGDIFQGILKCHENSAVKNVDAYDTFSEWNKLIDYGNNMNSFMPIEERLEREELIFDDIVKLDSLQKVMTCEILQVKDPDEENFNMQTEIQPKWKINIEKARSYQDVLAKEIMNIWDDIEIEEVNPSLFADALTKSDQSRENSSDRVTKWLRASNNPNIVIEEINFCGVVPTPDADDGAYTALAIQQSTQTPDDAYTVFATQQSTQTPGGGGDGRKKKKPRVAGF